MAQNARDLVECDDGRWQGADEHEASALIVLHCVLAKCAAAELWRCGAVCRAWRRAAADGQLWRRVMQPQARPSTLAALADLNDTTGCYDDDESVSAGGWWRGQYVLSVARWRRRGRLAVAAEGAAPAAAALHRAAPLLALLRDDGRITVWSTTECELADPASWQKRWEGGAGAEWSSGADARWAPRAFRLLVAGTFTLADRLEVIVYDFEVPGRGTVLCRTTATGAGGAAGCWVDDAVFITLELRLLAPGHACTTLWLNAATQKTQSEHAGVMSPLLRIYNEAAATISDVAVVELRPESEEGVDIGPETGTDVELGSREPNLAYYHALTSEYRTNDSTKVHTLIAVGGAAGGTRGCGRALLMWRLPRSLAPPQLLVQDGLAERVRRRRERPDPPPPEVEPDEATVRALCTPPQAFCLLPSQILGFVVHPNARCVWAWCAAGAACVSLPALRPLLWLPASPTPRTAPSLLPYRVLPAVDDDIFITPTGDSSGSGWSWLVRGGVAGATLAVGAPVLATLLLPRSQTPRTPPTLALLTTDALEFIEATAALIEPGVASIPAAFSSALTQFPIIVMETVVADATTVKSSVLCGQLELCLGGHLQRNDARSRATDMALLLAGAAHAARTRRPHLLSASLRASHAGAGRDSPVCRPSPCGVPAARRPPPPERITCTPPPLTGHPPPCTPPASPRMLDCKNAPTVLSGRRSPRQTVSAGAVAAADRCGLQLDAATRRLAAAERARRDNYERETATREPAPPPDFARYCLAAAADVDVPPACLVDDAACQIHRHDYTDPCAQYPQKEVHLDRSCEVSGSARSLAETIIKKFKRANTAAEQGGPSSRRRPRPSTPR